MALLIVPHEFVDIEAAMGGPSIVRATNGWRSYPYSRRSWQEVPAIAVENSGNPGTFPILMEHLLENVVP